MIRGLLRSWSGRLGIAVLVLVAATVLLSYIWVPHDPMRVVPGDKWLGLSWDHPFGTGRDGKDIFSGVVVGARVSVTVALASALIAGVIGITIGVFSAVTSRLLGEATANLVDVLIALPQLVLALVLVGLFGGSLLTVSVAIGVGAGVVLARVVRGETHRVLAQDYVMAAHASGTSTMRTIRRHVLPNIAPIVIVQLALVAGIAVVSEAALAYLGLTSASRPSWGRTLRDMQQTVTVNPGPIVFPAVALVLTAIGFNLLGDGLRDALDPRLRAARRRADAVPAAPDEITPPTRAPGVLEVQR
jgi:peptide/nickel transport system permease protein